MTGLLGKLIIEGKLTLKTGMHINAGNAFAAIGAVDSVVVRDTVSNRPYIPGSTLKGKMRFLLARSFKGENNMCELKEEDIAIGRLFGQSVTVLSRLQFIDIFFNEDSANKIDSLDTDLYLTEIKFENTIPRKGDKNANPRQLERVPAGAEFDFKLVYNVENANEVEEDFKNINQCLRLLEADYLGGHGTRGYGRVEFSPLTITYKEYNSSNINILQKAEGCLI